MAALSTALTTQLRIRSPIILAGMGPVSNANIAAAVTNAGGLGVLGGPHEPNALREEIRKLKDMLVDDKTCFGVDLLLPQVGGGARKTNFDYTQGKLSEVIDVLVEERCRLFVSAVGVPPNWVVERLHAAGCFVMNMVGHPKHVDKALDVGADMICAQGSEAGGHTGSMATMALVPQCIDRCIGRKSPLTGGPVHVIAAGGIYDGRTTAAALALGAEAVWVGTRFLASEESGGTKVHKAGVVSAGAGETVQTLNYSGRPCRMLNTEYVQEWEGPRKAEAEKLLAVGKIPFNEDMGSAIKEGRTLSVSRIQPLFMGQNSASIRKVEPVSIIMHELVAGAATVLKSRAGLISSKL